MLNDYTPVGDLPTAFPIALPTQESAVWFIRKHNAALKELGIIKIVNRRVLVEPKLLEQFILERQVA
jgi:hypothetical protein